MVLGSDIATLEPTQLQHLADEFAQVLTALHDPSALAALAQAGVDLPQPTPQADTAALRDRFCPLVDSGRRAVVAGWCDWADGVLEDTRSEQVVLHGDFHGYNVVVDATQTVQVILDLEEASWGDYHYDFRYLPGQEATLGLFLATVAAYERRTGRRVAFDRVTAWHLRTVLGDALWRTEAGVALPGGGTPEQWIDELEGCMTALDIDTR